MSPLSWDRLSQLNGQMLSGDLFSALWATAVALQFIQRSFPLMLQDFTVVLCFVGLTMRDEFKVHEKRNHIVHHVLIMLLT